jgi:hypothetical protein
MFWDAADEPCHVVAHYSLRSSLDDLVGTPEQRWRHREAEPRRSSVYAAFTASVRTGIKQKK